MRIAIIITTPDFAGLNIKDNLLKSFPEFKKMEQKYENKDIYELNNDLNDIRIYTTEKRCIYCEHIDHEIEADIFIFPTTHRSASGKPSLSCHTQGNWGKADLGGSPNYLGICPAILMKQIFNNLDKKAKNLPGLDEDITMEVTHHGPDIDKPVIFCEIGSDEEQWKREDLGRLWAEIIMDTLSNQLPDKKTIKTAIGIGGSHYCNNFNEIQLNNPNIAIGHICPKYAIDFLDENMIKQAIEKTTPRPTLAILDWKSIGERKQEIVDTLNKLNIEVKRTKEMKQ